MYHIKNDKRCIKSAETIVEALDQLLLKKPFLEITVTDIQKTAGIGRSTFYRHFDTIDDVVEYSVDESFKEIVKDFNEMSHRDFTIVCLRGVIESGEEMMNLLSSGRAEIVTRSFRRNLTGMDIKSTLQAQYGFALFAASCISVIRVWNENGRKESIEELADYMERFLKFEEM